MIKQTQRVYEAGRYQIRTVITDYSEGKPIEIVDLTEIYSFRQANKGKARSMGNALKIFNRRIRSETKKVYVRVEYGCAISKGMEKLVTDNIVLDMIGTYWELPKYDKEGKDIRVRLDSQFPYFFDSNPYYKREEIEQEEKLYPDMAEIEDEDEDEDTYIEDTEGAGTHAEGAGTHAEGAGTHAEGAGTHAEGAGTHAD